MSKIKNTINLKLSIKQNADNSYSYQYYSLLKGGIVVKVEGFIISEPTRFKVELSERTQESFTLKECLVPGHQSVVKVEKLKKHSVSLIDKDSDAKPNDYNFIIIAVDKHTGFQVVCDPQIRNRREL